MAVSSTAGSGVPQPEFSAFFSLSGCVILCKVLRMDMPMFSHVYNVDVDNASLEG